MQEEHEFADDQARVADGADTEETEGQSPEVQQGEGQDWTEQEEHLARTLGWKAPNEWQGERHENYIDNPRDFLEHKRGNQNVDRLLEEFNRREAAREREYEKRFRKMENLIREDAKREIERIRGEQEKAVESGDVEQWKKLREEEARARETYEGSGREQQPQEQQPAQASPDDQIARQWVQANQHIMGDPVAAAVADAAFAQMPNLPMTERLQYVEQTVQRELPQEAKDAFKRFVERGDFTDDADGRKQYVELYN